jgi:hypothetical protein
MGFLFCLDFIRRSEGFEEWEHSAQAARRQNARYFRAEAKKSAAASLPLALGT